MANWTIEKNFIVGTATVGSETITVNTLSGAKGEQGIQGEKGDDYASTLIENVVLTVANWTLVGGFYEYDYANVLIGATNSINVIPYNDSVDYVKFADIMPMVISGVGTVKMYAVNQPLADINVVIEII